MEVGIESIAFYTSSFKLDLKDLATANHLAPNYYAEQLGQKEMAVMPPQEDWVSIAANAIRLMLTPDIKDLAASREVWQETLKDVGLLLFATESAIEMSKASASYLHEWFKLPASCRILELKQACYGATGALQLAIAWLQQHPNKKALIVASDVARYKAHSSAESSQGAGAVAMLVAPSADLVTFTNSAVNTKQCLDFWHPNALSYALVDGKLSCEIYLKLLANCWQELNKEQIYFKDFKYFAYHSPVPKLVYAAHRRMIKLSKASFSEEATAATLAPMLKYTQQVGNCYSASLYLNLLSLIENQPGIQVGDKVALYSYGSGSIGELLVGYFNDTSKLAILQRKAVSAKRLAQRHLVSLKQLYAWQQEADQRERDLNWKASERDLELDASGFKLLKLDAAKRVYSFNLKELD